MHISFAVFADAANLSQEGKLNVLGIFDALHVAGFPSVHPRTHFVLRFKGTQSDVGKHTLIFRWVNPQGTELWQTAGELQLDAGQPAALDAGFEIDLPVIAVVDLPIDGPGQYSMHVDLDHTPVTRVTLVVGGTVGKMPTVGLMS
ncbi:MAG TPA: hypothetical protein VNU46_05905 [Gemmatimonadaceae bacterium]|nr:hypothetical protein [Gemmatimonadaceae bacterium]